MINLLNKFNEDWINFFEVSYDGIIVADKNGRIVYMNPAAEKLEEVNKSQIIGKLASDLEKEGIYEKSVTVMVLKEKRAVSVKQCKGDKQLIITGVPLFEDNAIKWIYINERDATELNKIKQEIERYKKQLNVLKANNNEYISESPIMKKTLSLLERIAPTDISVLISGESGVGKDVCAKWIHNHSMRKDKPFMKIDCGALSETLLESELFGYEGGAFTGASNKGKKGLAEVADGGTLFLDEIGELPISLQTKLLRLVQENVFLPVGGIKEKHVDIRIIAATNKNLEDMIENSTFRQDLYYRLSVFPIKIPPLRERPEDIFYFINYFLSMFNNKYGFQKTISNRAINTLCTYDWPGNVRELSNIIERLVVVTQTAVISERDVSIIIYPETETYEEIAFVENYNYTDAFEEFEHRYFCQLRKMDETLEDIAKLSGLSVSTLKRKFKKYSLRVKDKLNNEP